MKKVTENSNGTEKLPRAKDFKLPKRLTKDQRELIEATREAMKALKEEDVKYGKRIFNSENSTASFAYKVALKCEI